MKTEIKKKIIVLVVFNLNAVNALHLIDTVVTANEKAITENVIKMNLCIMWMNNEMIHLRIIRRIQFREQLCER